MLSIGEFSKICRCTTKALRHYDNIGLLKPAGCNPETGYRYYEAPQLLKVLFIQKLKNYGFSLKEIKKLSGADKAALQAVLSRKYEECAAQIERQKALLNQMKMDIWNLEKGMEFMETANIEIKLTQTPDINILSLRENIAVKDFDKLFAKVMDLLAKTGLECIGPPVAIYHSPEFDPENTNLEIGIPTNMATGQTRVLKGGKHIMAVHKGPYPSLSQAYARLAERMEKEGLVLAGPPYEKYVNSPLEVPEDQLLVEIYFPVNS